MDRQGTTLCKHGTPTNKKCEICELMTDKRMSKHFEEFDKYWKSLKPSDLYDRSTKMLVWRFYKEAGVNERNKTIDEVINRLESNKVYDELDDLIADALIEHGPDGHCDGHEKITILVLDEIKKALSEGKG